MSDISLKRTRDGSGKILMDTWEVHFMNFGALGLVSSRFVPGTGVRWWTAQAYDGNAQECVGRSYTSRALAVDAVLEYHAKQSRAKQ